MRYWGIEMKKARQPYLGTYSHVDYIDHLITNCHMKYRCWNYWRSPMIHAMSLSVVVSYDMYLEVEE